MRIGIAADHGGFGLKEDLRGRLGQQVMTLLTLVQIISNRATTIRISLLRWRRQWRRARSSVGLPFAEAGWELQSAPTKFRESAPL